ncbi:unnamed protein product [Effrenium voratum]|uniref:Glycosyltransferase 2-like domain-containing protein n=1 Tax=Effrenium voratum TaxID=2562239 RepID=A0AA36JBX3_9DINO|nr:unnamed protein product [Effrenium voratum]
MISVIMPCRNGMPFLPWALDDLASSSVALEVLVCDDGSSDGSAEWLQRLHTALEAPDVPDAPDAPSAPDAPGAPDAPDGESWDPACGLSSDTPWVQQEPWPGEDAAPSPAVVSRKMCAAGHRLVLLNSGGRGQGAAQNACLQAASAPLVGLMDADDRGDPERFQKLLDALKDHRDWIGACSQVRIFGTVSEGMARYVQWQNSLLQPEELMQSRFVEIPALHQSGLYPRSLLLETLQGYRDLPGWPIDIDTWMRLAEAGARIGKVPMQLYGWRQHTLQSTRNHGRCGIDRLRNCKAHFLLRSLPKIRRLEIWSTGETLARWREALQSQMPKEARMELALLDWRPKGRSRGGARRKEGEGGGGGGGGGAAAYATVKTEVELAAEMDGDGEATSQGQAVIHEAIPCSSPPPPLDRSHESVARVFVFGSEKLRAKAKMSSEASSEAPGRWGRLDWPAA